MVAVPLFLFLIGLEMRPTRLWALRKEIFGLGLAQVLVCGTLLTGVGLAFGWSPAVAVIGAMGFVLSSTAVILKMLDERGVTASPAGQRAVSILLLEDLAIIPLLALVAFLALASGSGVESSRPAWLSALVALGALGGLSMAMGAFIAGVLLSESTFRHQLEADIEPFRGILLGLFFLSVGMSLDLGLVASDWQIVATGVAGFMAAKALGIYAAALAAGVFDARAGAMMSVIVILSMALTQIVVLLLDRFLPRPATSTSRSSMLTST